MVFTIWYYNHVCLTLENAPHPLKNGGCSIDAMKNHPKISQKIALSFGGFSMVFPLT
jgi:hypothetical protein